MTTEGRAYIGSAHKVAIIIKNSIDYDSDDIQEITLTLTKETDNAITVQFTKSAAEVQIETKERLILYIHPGKVTASGGYNVGIKWTDKNGQPHTGTVVRNARIRFYE